MKVSINEKPVTTKGWVILAAIFIVLLIVVGAVFFAVGMDTNLNRQAVELASKSMIALDKEYQDTKTKLDDSEKKIEENSAALEEMDEYQKNKEKLNDELSTKTAISESLNTDIENKRKELSSLKGEIVKAKSEPKTLSAGEFSVGTDLPPGRYTVSGSSNFVVYGMSGGLKVNTILGNSSVGEGDYVCTLSTGDKMRLSSRTTFTPIE